jgi:hypothetical protein
MGNLAGVLHESPGQPSIREVMLDALDSAIRAPSTHNTQPWIFGFEDEPPAITLHADTTRALPIADPSQRELFVSCGTVLHHLRVALAARGRATRVERMPSATDRTFAARVTVGAPITITPEARALEDAIARRRTDHGQFEAQPLESGAVEALEAAAREQGARLVTLHDESARARVADLVAVADREQYDDPLFRDELAQWVHSNLSDRRDGIAVEGARGLVLPWIIRTFDRGDGEAARDRELILDGSPTIAVITTQTDLPMDWLRAGEALSAVLLRAAERNLSASYLSQVVEVDGTRSALSDLAGGGFVQVVLRLGLGHSTRRSARRPIEEMLRD